MALPALRQCIHDFCIHEPALNASIEALMNIMQATFLVLRSIPTVDNDILSNAHQIFCFLNEQYVSNEKVNANK